MRHVNLSVMATDEEIKEENRKIRRLKLVISLTTAIIAEGNLQLSEAYQMIEGARKTALALFPNKGDVFDLIYMPRFRRLLNEVYGRH